MTLKRLAASPMRSRARRGVQKADSRNRLEPFDERERPVRLGDARSPGSLFPQAIGRTGCSQYSCAHRGRGATQMKPDKNIEMRSVLNRYRDMPHSRQPMRTSPVQPNTS